MIASVISRINFGRAILIRFVIKVEEACLTLINSLVIAENKGLHPKHRLMKYHDFFLGHISENSTVIDVGCGIGAVSYDLALKAKRVVGVDMDSGNINQAKKLFSRSNIIYKTADVTEYESAEAFDYAVLSNVLEHLEDRIGFLRKIQRIAPQILLRVPMLNRDWLPLYKQSIGLCPFSDKTHFVEYTLDSFKKELDAAGLRIAEYSIQFGEVWAVVVKCETIGESSMKGNITECLH